MSETINIPKVGPVKRTYVIGGVAVVGAYVVYRYWLAAQGSAAPAEPGEYQPDTSSVTQSGGAPLTSDRTGNTTDTSGTDGVITTNDQWADRASERLALAGWEERVVLTALGKFLSRQALTDAEATIVRAATAVTGQPPVGGPYPIVLVTGGNTTPAKPGVPAAPGGLRAGAIHDDNVVLVWSAVAGASGYDVDLSTKPIKSVGQITSLRASGLKRQTRYSARIRARNKTGRGPWSPTITFTTGKKGT